MRATPGEYWTEASHQGCCNNFEKFKLFQWIEEGIQVIGLEKINQGRHVNGMENKKGEHIFYICKIWVFNYKFQILNIVMFTINDKIQV